MLFRGWMREIWSNQAQVLRIRTCFNEFCLNWYFGNRLRKNLKFWKNVPWLIRSLLKKWCAILSLDEGNMIKTSPCAPNSNLLLWILTELKFLGDFTSFPMAWCEQLGKLAMKELLNELHTHTTMDHKWTYTRLKNRSRPKGGHGEVIWKHGSMWHPYDKMQVSRDKIEGLQSHYLSWLILKSF